MEHSTTGNTPVPDASLTAGDADYHKGLSGRQMQMIAIGGAIGTGLFMGAGGRLAQAGPGIVISYAVCGFFAFLILRALGELVMHRPPRARSSPTPVSSTGRRRRSPPAGCTG